LKRKKDLRRQISLLMLVMIQTVLVGLVTAEQARAEQARAEQITADPMISVATESWPPFNYQAADGKIIGRATSKVHRIFELAGIDHQINLYPWARAYHLASTQPNTAIYTIIRTPSREDLFQWVCPLQKPARHFFFRQNQRTDIKIDTLKAAKNYHIGVTRNGFDQQYLQKNGFIEGHDFEVAASDEVNLKKVLKGRLDVVIGTEFAILEYLQRVGRDKHEMVKVYAIDASSLYPNCLAFGLQTPKTTVDKVRKALKQFNAHQTATQTNITESPLAPPATY
jgi:polar amino acid transport system substrate-binding protein